MPCTAGGAAKQRSHRALHQLPKTTLADLLKHRLVVVLLRAVWLTLLCLLQLVPALNRLSV